MWIHFFRVSHNKDAIKQQLSDAFADRDFQLILAFFAGAFVTALAFAVASRRLG
jgi:hypothetical protein